MAHRTEEPTSRNRQRRRWLLRLGLAATLVLFVGWSLNFCAPRCPFALSLPDSPNPNSHLPGYDDLDRIHGNLSVIAKEEAESMHRLLWRSTRLVRPLVVGRPWSEVKPLLDRQPLAFREPGG